jgi:hypothetical protein
VHESDLWRSKVSIRSDEIRQTIRVIAVNTPADF